MHLYICSCLSFASVHALYCVPARFVCSRYYHMSVVADLFWRSGLLNECYVLLTPGSGAPC